LVHVIGTGWLHRFDGACLPAAYVVAVATEGDSGMRNLPLNRLTGLQDSRGTDAGVAYYEVEYRGHHYVVRFDLATIDRANEILACLLTLASMGSDLQIQWEAGE
jgi:hypothetical protein